MSDITTIGLDLAKNIFQVHAVDAAGAVVVRRQLRRREGGVNLMRTSFQIAGQRRLHVAN